MNWCLLGIFSILLTISNTVNSDTTVLLSKKNLTNNVFELIVSGIRSSADKPVIVNTDISSLQKINENDNYIILGADTISDFIDVFPEPSANVYLGAYINDLPGYSDFNRFPVQISIDYTINEISKTGISIERIFTVASPQATTYIESVRAQLELVDIELEVLNSTSSRDTARAWFDIIHDANDGADALWISDSAFINESRSFRHILEEAWKRKIFVFTTVPSLASRGVSFGFIPNMREYGLHIANGMSSDTRTPNYLSTNTVIRRVLNKRSLRHLGLNLPPDTDKDGYKDLVVND